MVLKNVIQVGVTGNLGPVVLEALIASKKFNVTVGSRDVSSRSFPSGIKVVQIDYSSQASLVSAFQGQDAVLVTIGTRNTPLLGDIQMAIVDAAVTAGVSHIIPSNFTGNVTSHRKHPGAESKVSVEEHLEKLSSEGKISYSAIGAGFWFNWALRKGLVGVDLANKKAVLLNGGNFKINVTNLESIAETVIKILSEPDLVKNRLALVHDMYISQNDVLNVAEEELGAKFEVSYVNTDDLRRDSEARLAAGDSAALYGTIKASVFGPDSPSAWGVDDDSKFLGHAPKDLREEVVKVMTQMKLRAVVRTNASAGSL